jgi:hypothetical protein
MVAAHTFCSVLPDQPLVADPATASLHGLSMLPSILITNEVHQQAERTTGSSKHLACGDACGSKTE